MIDLGARIAILAGGDLVVMMPVHVAVGFTNQLFPLTCQPQHRHQPGDVVWTRADRGPLHRILFCHPCAREAKS